MKKEECVPKTAQSLQLFGSILHGPMFILICVPGNRQLFGQRVIGRGCTRNELTEVIPIHIHQNWWIQTSVPFLVAFRRRTAVFVWPRKGSLYKRIWTLCALNTKSQRRKICCKIKNRQWPELPPPTTTIPCPVDAKRENFGGKKLFRTTNSEFNHVGMLCKRPSDREVRTPI